MPVLFFLLSITLRPLAAAADSPVAQEIRHYQNMTQKIEALTAQWPSLLTCQELLDDKLYSPEELANKRRILGAPAAVALQGTFHDDDPINGPQGREMRALYEKTMSSAIQAPPGAPSLSTGAQPSAIQPTTNPSSAPSTPPGADTPFTNAQVLQASMTAASLNTTKIFDGGAKQALELVQYNNRQRSEKFDPAWEKGLAPITRMNPMRVDLAHVDCKVDYEAKIAELKKPIQVLHRLAGDSIRAGTGQPSAVADGRIYSDLIFQINLNDKYFFKAFNDKRFYNGGGLDQTVCKGSVEKIQQIELALYEQERALFRLRSYVTKAAQDLEKSAVDYRAAQQICLMAQTSGNLSRALAGDPTPQSCPSVP